MEGVLNIFICNVGSYGDKEEGFQFLENDESDDSRVVTVAVRAVA